MRTSPAALWLKRLRPRFASFLVALLLGLPLAVSAQSGSSIPHLAVRHGVTQIIVDGQPFLVRGGELENSSASSLPYLDKLWPKFVAMHFNTVIAPVYWQLIEPREGVFDFTTVDGLIQGARAHHMHLVLLWFGTWKNSMSCYVPDWVKENPQRFPRAELPDGRSLEILSALSQNNLNADTAAFVALMKHLRAIDAAQHTVLMIQVENEIGMIPKARDFSSAANAAFNAPVPAALTRYLSSHRAALEPALRQAWEQHGAKANATWPETFGPGPMTDELFNAWSEARYTNKVAEAGKAVYPLPMYVNAALIRPGRVPGQYPSGGPLPHLFDVWHAAAPAIDFLAPDIYFPNFVEWANRYARLDNPLFIPESGRADAANLGADAFYAYAQLNAMGFSVYAPEFMSAADEKTLAQAYSVLEQITPAILADQGTGRLIGIRPPTAFDGTENLKPQQFTLGSYTFTARFTQPNPVAIGAHAEPPIHGAHGGLIVQLGPNDFLVAGTGMILTFGVPASSTGQAGIDSIWEGTFVKGVWTPGRNLNGDDDNQGRWLVLPPGEFTMRRVKLYRYR